MMTNEPPYVSDLYDTEMKACRKCKEVKPLLEYSKHMGGLRSACKTCCRIEYAAWRAANPGKAKAASERWRAANQEKLKAIYIKRYAANPEKVKAIARAWHAKNREKTNARSAKWRANNPDRYKEIMAEWRAANPAAIRAYTQNRRARKTIGKLSSGIAERLFRLQRGKCACCGKPLGDNYHLDHIMPLALGGTNTDDNIQLLTASCNLKKHKKHPIDFMRQQGFLL